MPNPELATDPVPTESRGEPEPLEALIDEVRNDAQQKPKTYARESIVPEGGE